MRRPGYFLSAEGTLADVPRKVIANIEAGPLPQTNIGPPRLLAVSTQQMKIHESSQSVRNKSPAVGLNTDSVWSIELE